MSRDLRHPGSADRNRPWRPVLALVVLLAAAACAPHVPPAGGAARAVDGSAGVAAANPLAVDAGLAVLRGGGSAVDAAVAVQAMLGLVEPQSSGIGGGAFLMHFEAATGRVRMFDGREVAPASATPSLLLGDAGAPLPFAEAVVSGRATGVPGVMPMLGMAHARFGRLPWSRLFQDAIATAESGFAVPRRMARYAGGGFPQAAQPDVRAYLSRPDGSPVKAGDTLRNPAYAGTLRALAARGPRALHEGPIAQAIVDRLGRAPRPGGMTLADLSGYRPLERNPVCGRYRAFLVCVPPPPSSGASLLQLLAILEHTDIASRRPADPQAWFAFAEASRIMYADRDRYIADPDFVPVPVAGLLDSSYVAARARLIGATAGAPPAAGAPGGALRGGDDTREAAGTSHFIVVDARGDVVSMTTTVESIFGSGRSVGGFFLNNQMTDFSFVAAEGGVPVANAVAAGKRPRSSMSPAIVLDSTGRFHAAIGSPGGSAILAYNAKLLVGLLAWRLPMQGAIDLPNLYARGGNFFGEASKFPAPVASGLAARGVVVRPGDGEDSGLHGVIRGPGGRLEGAADPRRDGVWRSVRPD